jgi:hypothetical protein
MNRRQRARSLEPKPVPVPATAESSHYVAYIRITTNGFTFPRGAVIPRETIATIAPGKLSDLLRGGYIELRAGLAPKGTPAPIAVQVVDDAAEQRRMRENMLAAGYEPWMMDPRLPRPPGAYKRSPELPGSAAPMTASEHANAAHPANAPRSMPRSEAPRSPGAPNIPDDVVRPGRPVGDPATTAGDRPRFLRARGEREDDGETNGPID